ncbi:MAG: DUF6226 family protein [Actinomycetota bacterium]|nr:DUF6226 family protein [Actinomycetota bacterium]
MKRPPSGSDDDAYVRVTNPGRYAVLHSTAWLLVETLEANYLVDRIDGWVDPGPALRVDAVSAVRLVPAGGGAPIAITLTKFPGLAVRLGYWLTRFFPACGCDACDEKPDELVGDLQRYVHAVVAGRFREELRTRPLRGGSMHHELWGDDWLTSEEQTIDRQKARHLGAPARVEWGPWPRR